jgi:hypothetical protein
LDLNLREGEDMAKIDSRKSVSEKAKGYFEQGFN